MAHQSPAGVAAGSLAARAIICQFCSLAKRRIVHLSYESVKQETFSILCQASFSLELCHKILVQL